MTLKEVCLECNRQMEIVGIGAVILEQTEKGEPYKLWHCDLLGCPECGMGIATRFADSPLSQKGAPDWNRRFDFYCCGDVIVRHFR
jgi:hypothetical protein